nr:hypothetical protein [Tanacetum cinerariifolium]
GDYEKLWDEFYRLETSMMMCFVLGGATANKDDKGVRWVRVLDMQVTLHDKRIVMQVTLHYEAIVLHDKRIVMQVTLHYEEIVMQVTLHDKRIVMQVTLHYEAIVLHDKRIVMQVTLHYEEIVMQVTLHDKRIVMQVTLHYEAILMQVTLHYEFKQKISQGGDSEASGDGDGVGMARSLSSSASCITSYGYWLWIVSSGWSSVSTVLGQMTYPVTILTLDRARSYVMQGASFTHRIVSSIPIGGSINPEGFLLPILLVVVIIVTVVIVVVIFIVIVVAIVRGVIVVAIIRVVVVIDVSSILKLSFVIIGWAYAFNQDKASSVRVPVENVTLFSSAQLLRENTDSVRSNQRMSPTALSVPLK